MTPTEALLLAGLAVLGAAAGADLVLGARRTWTRLLPYLASMLGSACLVCAGALMMLLRPESVDLGAVLDLGHTSLRLDPLAGMFLTITSGLGVILSAGMAAWCLPAEPRPSEPPPRLGGRGTGAGYALLLGSVAVVTVAGDAFTFLFAWEALTISFYVLSGVTRSRPNQPRAAWMTLGIGKGGGALLLLGFLLLAGNAHSLDLAAWHTVSTGAVKAAAYALVVAGFGAKVGLAPFQVWMPEGYPQAPGPVRAAMAGLGVNAGFYGLWRLLGILGAPPVWLAALVVVVGGITALLGVVFAAVQSNLDRVISYSSVENGGVIMVAYGVALAGAATHHPGLVAVGLLAATLQVIAHAVAKAGIFTAASNVEADYGTSRLDELGGLRRTHPWSAVTFTLSALTLAGLPPTIGFASEWFVLEALMQQFRTHELALRLTLATAGALVALTAGLAALVFARLVGFAVLGRRSGDEVETSGGERSWFGRAGLVVLGTACLGLAAAAPYVVRFVARGLDPVVAGRLVARSLKSPWVLQPVFRGFSILSPSWVLVVMPIGFVGVAITAVILSRGRVVRVRRVPPWRSATGGVAGPASYSAFGYANVARHVLGNVLRSRRSVLVGDASATAAEPSADRDPQLLDPARVTHVVRVADPIDAYLYRPARRGLLSLVRWARRLQSGHIAAYIGYMLFALVAVLVVAAALG